MEKLFRNASVLAAGAIVTAILAPVFARGLTPTATPGFAPEDACVGNARLLVQAVRTYAQDYDGKLPPTDTQAHFQAVVTPYVSSVAVFTCPATHLAYVPNPAIGGHNLAEYQTNSDTTVVFQDAVAHADHKSTVAFLDGHIERGGVEAGDPNAICVSRVKQITLAMMQYVQDNDEVFPPVLTPAAAKAALLPYTPSPRVFTCPATGQLYEFNTALAGMSLASIANPSSTVEVQDPIAHADGIKTIGYVDGHVTHGAVKPTSVADTSNLKLIGLAVLQYTQDNDEKFPPMQTEQAFETAVNPYLQDPQKFLNPLTGQTYLLNAGLSYQSLASLSDPASTLLARDRSVNPDGTLNSLYADGHVSTRRYYVAQHLSVGTNNETRLIWNRADGYAVLSRLSASGVEQGRRVLGPHAGKVVGIATAPSGVSSILWGENNGAAALWTVNAGYAVTQMVNYGPYDGWTASSVAVGGDGLAHVLWNRYSGVSSLWWTSAAGDYVSERRYGQVGDKAVSIADGASNTVRIGFSRPSGETRLWTLSPAGDLTSQGGVSAYQDWKLKFVTVGPDNNTHALIAGTSGSVLLTVSPTQTPIYRVVLPAEAGWTPQEIGVGADGFTRVLATNLDGRSRVRSYNNEGIVQNSHEFAPF